jgi:uncharacterized membrane protein
MPGESGASEDEEETPLEQAVSGVVIALIFLVGFGLMFAGVSWFWVAFPVGFAGLLPAAIGLVRWYEHSQESESKDGRSAEEEALDELKARYARGELTDEEFERRVERLLETESVEDAETFLGRGGSESENVAGTEDEGVAGMETEDVAGTESEDVGERGAVESERQPETEVE